MSELDAPTGQADQRRKTLGKEGIPLGIMDADRGATQPLRFKASVYPLSIGRSGARSIGLPS